MSGIRRILHIAPLNISGVPITFVRAERELGFESRLITLARDPRGYEEDICLALPFVSTNGVQWAKRVVSDPKKLQISNRRMAPAQTPPIWQPHSRAEKWLITLRETLWQSRLRRVAEAIDLWSFDLYQLEGGLEFFRDGRTVRELKRRGKKIVVLYTGSDFRTRGIIPAIDSSADLRLTLEFDHLRLDPGLTHIFFPFQFESLRPLAIRPSRDQIVIGHAPTNRHAKGSEAIIAAVQSLAQDFPIRLELIEGVSHAEAIRRKADCDIFVDNISELGYGVNAIEALALSVCTCTSLMPEFLKLYPDHPFVEITLENVREQLHRLCANPELRHEFGRNSRAWAEENYNAAQIIRRLHLLVNQQVHQRDAGSRSSP
jgi:glycosyltransferase involved in cell wall biosynthesis